MKRDLVKFYERAILHATRTGYAQEATDFASWVIIRALQGKASKQLLRHSFIDYLREEYGCKTVKKWKQVDVEVDKIDPDSSPEDTVIVTDSIEKLTTPFERELMRMYYVEGRSLEEIGNQFGRSEAYMSNRLKIIRERIAEGRLPEINDKDGLRGGDPSRKKENHCRGFQEETV